jgi:hypothetical protein
MTRTYSTQTPLFQSLANLRAAVKVIREEIGNIQVQIDRSTESGDDFGKQMESAQGDTESLLTYLAPIRPFHDPQDAASRTEEMAHG